MFKTNEEAIEGLIEFIKAIRHRDASRFHAHLAHILESLKFEDDNGLQDIIVEAFDEGRIDGAALDEPQGKPGERVVACTFNGFDVDITLIPVDPSPGGDKVVWELDGYPDLMNWTDAMEALAQAGFVIRRDGYLEEKA